MGITEKFLVNTNKFKAIVETLQTADTLPEKIDEEYLEELGYSTHPDFLVLYLFKELGMLEEDGTPTPLFEKFRNQESSKEAIAYGIIKAYGDLFKDDPEIHKSSADEISEMFRIYFGSEKSDIILNYMANTFKALVDYVGVEKLESVLEQKGSGGSNIESIVKEIAHKYSNGSSDSEETTNGSSVEVKERSETEVKEEESQQETEPQQEESTMQDSSDEDILSKDEFEEKSIDEIYDIIEYVNEAPTIISEEGETEEDTGETDETETEDAKALEEEQPDDETEIISFEVDVENKENEAEEKKEPKEVETTDSTKEDIEVTDKDIVDLPEEVGYINKAFVKKAALLYKLERYKDALPALEEVFQRFADADNQELQKQASLALIRKMKSQESLELHKELIPTYNKIIDRLEDTEQDDFVEPVDHAYIKRVDILLEVHRDEEALKAIDQAITRFKDTDRKQDYLEKSMFTKAELLEDSGKLEEALQAYEAFLNLADNNDDNDTD